MEAIPVPEIAQQLHVTRARVYQLIAEKRIPHVRRGRRVIVPRVAWDRFCQAQVKAALASVA